MAIKTIQFGREGYNKSTPRKIVRFAYMVKTICWGLSILSFVKASPMLSFAILGIKEGAEEICKFFYED